MAGTVSTGNGWGEAKPSFEVMDKLTKAIERPDLITSRLKSEDGRFELEEHWKARAVWLTLEAMHHLRQPYEESVFWGGEE